MTTFEIPNNTTVEGHDLMVAMKQYNASVDNYLTYEDAFLNAYAKNYPLEAKALTEALKMDASIDVSTDELQDALQALDSVIYEYDMAVQRADKKIAQNLKREITTGISHTPATPPTSEQDDWSATPPTSEQDDWSATPPTSEQDDWSATPPTSEQDAPQPSSQATNAGTGISEAPAAIQATPPKRSVDLAPEASEATFRARLMENKDASEKDASKPSYELTAPDASGVQELTIHLPSPEDVRNSRITDFVGREGVAIQKTEEELGKMTLVLLADDHGQKAGTEYTWKEGTWRNAQGERLKIYDGTKITIKNPVEAVAVPEDTVEEEPTTKIMDQKTFETGKPTGRVRVEETYTDTDGVIVSRTAEGEAKDGKWIGEVAHTSVIKKPGENPVTTKESITVDEAFDPNQFDLPSE